jgi:hypothetical protein
LLGQNIESWAHEQLGPGHSCKWGLTPNSFRHSAQKGSNKNHALFLGQVFEGNATMPCSWAKLLKAMQPCLVLGPSCWRQCNIFPFEPPMNPPMSLNWTFEPHMNKLGFCCCLTPSLFTKGSRVSVESLGFGLKPSVKSKGSSSRDLAQYSFDGTNTMIKLGN